MGGEYNIRSGLEELDGKRDSMMGSSDDDVQLPTWVRNLLEYFKTANKTTRKSKEGNKDRSRDYYQLNCLLCEKLIADGQKISKKICSPTGCSSFTFARHLERHHSEAVPKAFIKSLKEKTAGAYKRKFSEDEDDDDDQECIEHSTIGTTTASKERIKYNETGNRQTTFNTKVLNWMVRDGVPFNAASKDGFRELMCFADDRLTVYSGQTYSKHLDAKHEKVVNHIKAGITGIQRGSAHLMLDIWSTRAHMSVIGAQARFIKNWQIRQYLLGFKHFPGTHDAKNLRGKLEELLSENYGLSLDDFHTITADNASNILSAFKDDVEQPDDNATHTVSSPVPAPPNLDTNETTERTEGELLDVGIDDEEEILGDVITDEVINSAIEKFITEWLCGEQKKPRRKRNSCLAHLLQLAIKDALRNADVSALMKKVTKIVNWFHKSNKYYDALRASSKIGLVKPIETRWNSAYHCLKRICRDDITVTKSGVDVKVTLSDLVNEVLSDAKKNVKRVPQGLNEEDVATIRVLIKLLEPFATLTDTWQGDGVTSSTVILGLIDSIRDLADVIVDDISEQAEVFLLAFKKQLRDSVILRFSTSREAAKTTTVGDSPKRNIVTTDIFNDERFILATLLDPRMKTIPFEENFITGIAFKCDFPTKQKVLEILKSSYKIEEDIAKNSVIVDEERSNISSQNSQERQNVAGTSRRIPSKPSKTKRSIFGRLQQHQNSKANKEQIVDELEQYLNAAPIPEKENPLNFWRLHEERLPILAELAKKYLAIPATSASVERLFSVAGAMISSRRASMHISTAEKLLLYKDYLRRGLTIAQ